MNSGSVKELFDRFFSGDCSDDERRNFLALVNDTQYEQVLKDLLEEKFSSSQGEISLADENADQVLKAIVSATNQAPPAERRNYFRLPGWVRYAAAILIVLGAATYLWLRQPKEAPDAIAKTENSTPVKTAIVPGGNKALLTLSDGRTIVLDSAGNGQLTRQGNVRIVKLSNGELKYEVIADAGSGQNAKDVIAYNTMSTPRGGQYQLVLPDGSKVWLNAESSISYPVKFAGQTRDVSITGEAYFEVAKNPSKPFTVKVNDMTVEVLGTHFNVMGYGDEASINTTLLEGSLKISGGSNSGLLKPGQQSVYNKTSQAIGISKADTEKALAWKNGNFIFKSDDIKTIMRQLSRWYDVTVSYEGAMPAKLYSGIISKYVDATEVLNILELAGIKFKIEGKNITVLH
jgi:ferric-dicitrate binding protein FerR (iron transport regulator)